MCCSVDPVNITEGIRTMAILVGIIFLVGITNAQHCGLIFTSDIGRKNGTFNSPGYPDVYSSDMTCEYTFVAGESERVQISFDDFDLYVPEDASSESSLLSCDDEDNLSVFNNEEVDVRIKVDTFCGSTIPPNLMSSGNVLSVVLTSGQSGVAPPQGKGFAAHYAFVSDFGIDTGGHMIDQGCLFTYNRVDGSSGTFTSPNYPGLYPRDTECNYLFYANPGERIKISFSHFDIEGIQPACSEDTQSDYVEFSNFNIHLADRTMPRLCGNNIGAREVVSESNFFRVTFKSNSVYDASGFQGVYEMVPEPVTEEEDYVDEDADVETSEGEEEVEHDESDEGEEDPCMGEAVLAYKTCSARVP